MFTSDGHELHWPYSDAPQTSCSFVLIQRLLEGDAASRAIAHAELSPGQFAALYRATNGVLKRGQRWRLIGKKIVEHNLYDYARGIGERKLATLVSKHKTRKALISALLEGT